MSDEPDSPTLRPCRRMDDKLDRFVAGVGDLKQGMTSAERQLADVRGGIAGLPGRTGRIGHRLGHIERRLDLVPTH